MRTYGRLHLTLDELRVKADRLGPGAAAVVLGVPERQLRAWLNGAPESEPAPAPRPAPAQAVTDQEVALVRQAFATLTYPAGTVALIAGRCHLGRTRTLEVLQHLQDLGMATLKGELWRL